MTDTLTAEQRASKVAKVTALLAKTMTNGCTQEESLAARNKAEHLMAQYSITEAECQPQTRRTRPAPTPKSNFWDVMMQAMREQEAQEAARVNYRKAGVHVDEGYHTDCRCAGCTEIRRQRVAQKQRSAQQRAQARADRGYTGTDSYVPPESPYSDPSTGRREQASSYSYTGRRNTSHKGCDHEATSTGRARCRKARGY